MSAPCPAGFAPLQVAQYIGEMCRYVLAVPPRPEDQQHGVRLMLGNGMRPTIWKTFVDRFNIPNVVELYGATEGNANIGQWTDGVARHIDRWRGLALAVDVVARLGLSVVSFSRCCAANLDNTIGAVGFLPQSLPQSIYPVAIIKTNLETGEILRNEKGFCERCDVGKG